MSNSISPVSRFNSGAQRELTDEEVALLADQAQALRMVATSISEETAKQDVVLDDLHSNINQVVERITHASSKTLGMLRRKLGPRGLFLIGVLFIFLVLTKILEHFV